MIAFEAAMRVAILYKIVAADCDRGRIKTTVNLRLIAAKHLNDLSTSSPSELLPLTMSCCILSRNVVALHLLDILLNVNDDKAASVVQATTIF